MGLEYGLGLMNVSNWLEPGAPPEYRSFFGEAAVLLCYIFCLHTPMQERVLLLLLLLLLL